MSTVTDVPMIDPAVTIPASAKAAAALADQLFHQANPAAAAPAAPEGGLTIAEPPAPAPAPGAVTVVGAPVTPEVTPPVEPAADDQTWEHKYKSMKGRWEASDATARRLGEMVTNLEGVIATMHTIAPTAPVAAAPVSPISAEDREKWGDELLDVVSKQAKHELFPELKSLKDELQSMRGTLEVFQGQTSKSAQDKMHDYLTDKVPTWEALNGDDRFIAWLGLQDRFSGAIRHELLKTAYARNDAARVVAFFQGFLDEEAAVDPTKVAQPDPNTVAKTGKIPLETFAAPGRAKSAAPDSPAAEKPTISRAQILAFYAAVAAGKYRGRDQEKAAHEAMIFAAEKEGRITA